MYEYGVAALDGSPLYIVYIRHVPGSWSVGADVTALRAADIAGCVLPVDTEPRS
ncbi:hypothetical protein [Streptomyces erythrochromogenes]|uniref:hypothetical protein n=1 Tax=Streptomyces erythrochromogenes TaxID=285574 RepID=UPI00368E8A24